MTISELIVFEPKNFSDDRKHFFESYSRRSFEEVGRTVDFVQDNQSLSVRDDLRGLHYQVPPHTQGELVCNLRGAVWDVAVDIRGSSSASGRWFGIELSSDNKKQLPGGMAHGFLAQWPIEASPLLSPEVAPRLAEAGVLE